VSAEARGPEKRGAGTRGSREAGAESAGAEAQGHRKTGAAGVGPQEPVAGAQGHREAGVDGVGLEEPVADATGAEKRTVGERAARTPGTRATAARGSQDQGAASAGSGAFRKPGARAAETGELRMSDARAAEAGKVREPGATTAEAGEAREPGTAVAADPSAGTSDGVDGESDKASDPESQAEIVVRDAISAPDVDGRPRRATRRFPLFTRDTARPEGGGRAAPRDAPAPARQWPVLAVLATVGLGLLLTALDQFRYGTLLVGLALLAGAVLRWLLPDVGMLAVRSRFTDIATYGVLGTAIVLLAMMVQPNPWLVIPFLKDTLHFTVSSN
jgi:hypothetical protein